MPPNHADNPLFPCSRCGKPTRCNDLLRGEPGRVQICDSCHHAETIQELDKTHDYFTDHDFRGEEPPHDSDPLEGPDIAW